jgi:TonB-linked SusC/RagA family outer membrane protein
MVLMGMFLCSAQAFAQQRSITGRITNEQGAGLAGVGVLVKGTTTGTSSNSDGNYSIRASTGQVLQYRLIGTAPEERTVGSGSVINVELRRVTTSLDAIVVTALGQTTAQRALGTAQQTVQGAELAQTQRIDFVNALQGRIAGVDVTSSSGVPGASTSITIRGVSSISSSNQPLMIVDGLPLDNKTLNTGVLASDASGSVSAFNNRGVDFSNRAGDVNPEDIETITVLKGPEASALYGIDAANGAIVITTKRGKVGVGGLEYSNSFSVASANADPKVQQLYGPTTIAGNTLGSFQYFGAPYPAGTPFYDNINGFFRNAFTQKHNLGVSGRAADSKIGYRLSVGVDKNAGVVPNSDEGRVTLTGRSDAQVKPWLNVDLSMQYMNLTNNQPYHGDGGPLLGLLLWPQTDNAKDYLSPAGTRRRLTNLSVAGEIDNPYFNVNKNQINAKTNRLFSNLGLTVKPVSWGEIRSNLGVDTYTNQNLIVRSPESALGNAYNGVLDQADDLTRNINTQTVLSVNSHPLFSGLSISGLLGNAVRDERSNTDAQVGQNFLDPNFISINNTDPTRRQARTTLTQRRVVSGFGSATIDFRRLLYATVTGRNDWTSTIPQGRNSFFYPSISSSFIFSDAFPTIGRHMTGKLRAAWAEVGRDARPYAYRPSLQSKLTTGGGYGYDFWGPNLALEPEFAKSTEVGTELGFLDDRLGIDATVWRKETQNQIVNDTRGSYGTGFILFNINGASTRNQGVELTLRGTPLMRPNFSWDVQANYASSHGKTLALPRALPESYVSDTWLYGNVRNGTQPGLSTMSLTGLFYLRDTVKSSPAYGQILIDPNTGLPIRSTTFIDGGYDRQPKYTIGISNNFKFKRVSLNFLVDLRRGGDIFNATEHYLTTRGLAMSTTDRQTPRVIPGVLRDGKETSANPTPNNIVIVPAVQTGYYTSMSEELFIEKNINWVRLRDVTVRYELSGRPLALLGAQNAYLFVTGNDLFLRTNYSGLDPIVNGNSAAVGGSGGVGIDFGNFPIPRSFNLGLKLGY